MGVLSPRAATGALALLILATSVFAQGVVDQQNDPTAAIGFGCGSPTPILNGTVLQSFVPGQDSLIAVELRLQAGSAFPSGGTVTTARIRDGSSTGTVLGTTTASVAGPLSQGTQLLVRFDFAKISLVPGNTYLIEWVTPPTTELTWVGTSSDPYAAGTAYSCSGNVWPGGLADLNFITYAADPPPPPPPEPAPEPTPDPAPEPLTCDEMLEALSAKVADLELHKFKKCSLDRLLDRAAKELARDKPRAASALVLAVEGNIRVLDRLNLISDDEAKDILAMAESFRECLGVEPNGHGHWHWNWHGKDHHQDGHDH